MGIAHQSGHLGKGGLRTDSRRLHHQSACEIHRGSGDGCSHGDIHGNAFAREHRNVDRGCTLADHAVGGDDLPGTHHDEVTDLHLGCSNDDLVSVAQYGGVSCTERQE